MAARSNPGPPATSFQVLQRFSVFGVVTQTLGRTSLTPRSAAEADFICPLSFSAVCDPTCRLAVSEVQPRPPRCRGRVGGARTRRELRGGPPAGHAVLNHLCQARLGQTPALGSSVAPGRDVRVDRRAPNAPMARQTICDGADAPPCETGSIQSSHHLWSNLQSRGEFASADQMPRTMLDRVQASRLNAVTTLRSYRRPQYLQPPTTSDLAPPIQDPPSRGPGSMESRGRRRLILRTTLVA